MRIDWAAFKALVDAREICIQETITESGNYLLEVFDQGLHRSCRIEEGSADATDYEDNYQADHNKQLSKVTTNLGIPKVAVYEPEGDFLSYSSHDWTDRTTWFQESTRVTGETLTLDTGLIYDSANSYWIDLQNGKVSNEDSLSAPYLPKIYDNAVEQTIGTDYTIDYDNGKVTFTSTPTGPVTADYSYENGSTYTLAPASGKIMRIEHAEIQFSQNVVMKTINWEFWAYNPADLPNKMLVEERVYKNEKDILNISNLGYKVPAFGALTQDVIVLPFNYSRVIDMKASQGVEVRVRLPGDVPLGGEFGTITFYTIEEDE